MRNAGNSDRKSFLEKIHQHLFADEDTSVKIFTKPEQDMIIRYRALFTKWLDDWALDDKNMVKYIMEEYGMSQSAAYNDVANIKYLLGNVKNAGKEFQRYRANEMVMSAYKIANDADNKIDIGRAEAIVKAAVALVKINKLNMNEDEPVDWDSIIPADFETTDDVSVLGIKKIPNLKEVQAKIREKYLKDQKAFIERVEDVNFEDVSDGR